MPFTDLTRLARRQHGVVTRAQALDALTRHQLDHAIATTRLEPVHRGVYRVAGSPESWEQAAFAAALAGGAGAVVSFLAGAHLWNLAGFWEQARVTITVPYGRRARLHDVTVHDSQILDGPHVDRRHGIPVTSVARTLCDLTACCWPNQVGRALDDALRRKLTSLRSVQTVFDDLATRGRRRSTMMRTLLAERGPGFDFHSSRTAFDDRYERDRALRIAGWLIVYVTHRTSRPRLVADVRQALELRGWPALPTLLSTK